MPSRGFQVLRASSSPFSTDTSTTTSPLPPCRAATAATCSRMNCRGIGLIAGSPTGRGSPGLVTVPTPGPARKVTPEPAGPCITVTETSAPWVTSGSSPASLTTPAPATPSVSDSVASANDGCLPWGRSIVTGSGNSPVSSAVYAAVVAAVAHAPVVHPYRSPGAPSLLTGQACTDGHGDRPGPAAGRHGRGPPAGRGARRPRHRRAQLAGRADR